MNAPEIPLALSPEDRQRVELVETLAREEAVSRLVDLLDDRSWAVRRAVIAALARLGELAVAPLCEILRSRRDNEARLAATVDALSASSGNVLDAVASLLETPSPPVLCDALQVLGRRKEGPALGYVLEMADHEDDNVAVAAIEAMGRIGGKSTVDPLLAAVAERNFFRTFPAIDALGRTADPRAIQPLAALLEDPLYAAEAARALGRTAQEAAIPALAPLLAQRNDSLVRTAAMALVDLAQHHEMRFGASRMMAEALRSASSAGVASARVCACLNGASPSEQLALVHVLGWIADDLSVAQLVEMLDAEGALRQAAVDALRGIGEPAAPHLLASLKAGSSSRRARLLPLVGFAQASIDAIVSCLDDADPSVRALACEALARAANTSVVPELFRLITDADARVAQAAAGAIQSLGSVETKRLALTEARSQDPRARRAALRIVSYFGYAEGLDILVAGAADADERIRETAIAGLPLLDDPRAKGTLLDVSRHAHAKTRASAIRALGSTTPAPEVVARLREALADEDPWVRYYACQSLAKLRVADAADLIIARMEDTAGQVRVAAVDALAHLRSDRALEALSRAAAESDPDIRRAAIVGLGTIREPKTLPLLRDVARSPDPATRLVAISALAEFSVPEVVPLLAHAASDPSENVRAAAIGFLATRAGDAATKALIDQLPNPAVRDRVIAALAVAPDGRAEGILSALESAGAELASWLVAALVRMRRPSGFAAIAAALAFENVEARRAAAAALAALGTREANDALRRVAAGDLDPEVRRYALAAMR
jgi:HEAT repeat protein